MLYDTVDCTIDWDIESHLEELPFDEIDLEFEE